jgi:hypothetical protein
MQDEKEHTTGGRQCEKHSRECDRENGSPSEADGDGKRHTLLPLRKREDLCRVAKGHGALTRRVEGRKEEDEYRDGRKASLTYVWVNQEAEAGG